MFSRFTSFLFSLMFIVTAVNAKESAISISPLPARTAKTYRDTLRRSRQAYRGTLVTISSTF